MQRRRVLAGLATAGVSLLAGCNTGGNGDGGGGGNATTQSTADGGGEPSTPGDSATSTPAATTIAETAQQTAAQTAIATSTPAATSTSLPTQEPVTTSTSMPTPESTAGGTTGPGTVIGSMDIDLSNLQTYTNDELSYSIKYPAGWTKSESQRSSSGGTTAFISGGAVMLVQSIANMPVSSVDSFMTSFLGSFGQSFETFETTGKQTVTLPNGHSGTTVDITARNSSTSLRGKALFALVNQTVYDVIIMVPQRAYTPSIEQGMTTIITSLTIE